MAKHIDYYVSLMSPWMDGAPTWMRWAVAIGGSATCNGFWLVSRALFRGEGGPVVLVMQEIRLPRAVLGLLVGAAHATVPEQPAAPAGAAAAGAVALGSARGRIRSGGGRLGRGSRSGRSGTGDDGDSADGARAGLSGSVYF